MPTRGIETRHSLLRLHYNNRTSPGLCSPWPAWVALAGVAGPTGIVMETSVGLVDPRGGMQKADVSSAPTATSRTAAGVDVRTNAA